MNARYKNDRLSRTTVEYMAQAKSFFADMWENLFDFFNSYRWREILFDLKVLSVIISLIFAGLAIFLLLKMNTGKKMQKAILEKKSPLEINKKRIIKKWKKIEKKILSDSKDNHKLAILEADEIFEEALKILGESSIIRVKNSGGIEEAKKTRNSIIDDSEFNLIKEDARRVVEVYRVGLENLGAF